MEKKINRHWFVGDFETLSTKNTAVYRWGFYSSRLKKYWEGWKIGDFISLLEKLGAQHSNSNRVFFHNGSGFDFHFILKYLGQNSKYQQRKFVIKKNTLEDKLISPYRLENTISRGEKWKPFQYSALIDVSGRILQLKMTTQVGDKMIMWVFNCSLRIWAMPLKKMGKLLNQHLNTTKFTKGDTPLRKINYLSQHHFENDFETKKYLRQDVNILFEWIYQYSLINNLTHLKMTIASTTYSLWQRHFLNSNQKLLKSQYGISIKIKEDGYKLFLKDDKIITEKIARNFLVNDFLPTKWQSKEENFLRDWYRGGMTITAPKFIGLKQENVDYYDINSSYPNVMMTNNLPFGEPYFGDGGDNFPFKLYQVEIESAKNRFGLPFIPVRMGSGSFEYPEKINNEIVYLSSPEYENMKKYYNGEWKANVKYSFKVKKGSWFFGDFIKKFWKIKSSSKSNIIERTNAKILMNSLYGKFGSKNEIESKIFNPFWNGETNFEREITIDKPKFYIPLAIAITAFARMRLVDAVSSQRSKFIACDTDSIIVKPTFKPNFEISQNLGAWKQEHQKVFYLGARKKCYVLWKENNNVIHYEKIAIAGYRLSEKNFHWRDIIFGNKYPNHLRKCETENGIFLDEYVKEIKPIWDKSHGYPREVWFKNEAQFKKVGLKK